MTFENWGFIYLGGGTEDPMADRAVIETGGLRTTIVAVPERSAAAKVAVELVEGGAQTIEICGAFGAATVAQVIEGHRRTSPGRLGDLRDGVCPWSGRALRADEVTCRTQVLPKPERKQHDR